ncbi:MAG TPA: carboxypeptidase-like regulatory domain-containing protein, partial [Kofleriaceae bacterium]|nr:carboxypeptidase-like regulatory domain-containing protein [Kofleriaceae bacterium]
MARRSCALAVTVVALGCGDDRRTAPASPPPLTRRPAPAVAADVTIAGSVVDQVTGNPIADVEVVLRGDAGDRTTRTNASGDFTVRGAPGRYHVFVRDERSVSTGLAERVRLDSFPRRELAGAADEGLMLALDARTDLTGIELTVAPAAE